MMNTPICDFVRRYAESGGTRLHMPGHKGKGLLGMEQMDITEIAGADSLYEADGIIRESERNAGALFGAQTFYSTEGSSLCIRAMLYLAALHAKKQGKRLLIAAGRNAHKTFLSAAALMDFEVLWLKGEGQGSYLSCAVTAGSLEDAVAELEEKPAAVYLTSPDYLGNMTDIASVARVCRKHGMLLMVDNAHGAYLKFLPESMHPMDLGADVCCDSAHKTLPVLTGGAYLHISSGAPEGMAEAAKRAMGMFGSTSPSYLILQSLDAANRYLAEGGRERLAAFLPKIRQLKARLVEKGYSLTGDEPMKLTIEAKKYGYTGTKLADELRRRGIECEFADPDYLVLMMTPENGEDDLLRLENALISMERREEICVQPPVFSPAEKILSIREASLSSAEEIDCRYSLGRVLAAATVGCPPAVPIVVCGEQIDRHAIKCFEYYGIEKCVVVSK